MCIRDSLGDHRVLQAHDVAQQHHSARHVEPAQVLQVRSQQAEGQQQYLSLIHIYTPVTISLPDTAYSRYVLKPVSYTHLDVYKRQAPFN